MEQCCSNGGMRPCSQTVLDWKMDITLDIHAARTTFMKYEIYEHQGCNDTLNHTIFFLLRFYHHVFRSILPPTVLGLYSLHLDT